MARSTLCKVYRDIFLDTVDYHFRKYRVDLVELGNDKIWGSGGNYRDIRPWSCCGGLTPEEEMKWHVYHIKNCLTYVDEMQDFCEQLTDLIKRKGKRLSEKKEQAIKRIKSKDITRTCFNYSKHEWPIIKCTNSKQLTEKENKIVQEIEQLSSQAQTDEEKRRKQEEENERLKKEKETKWQKDQEEWEKNNQEEKEFLHLGALIQDCQDLATLEKNYQIVKSSPLYTTNKKTFVENKEDNKTTLDNYYKNKKNFFLSSQEKLNNHKDGENPNDGLESEIQNLKNQNSFTLIPEQQAETQKKIEQKEKELEEAKKDKENDEDNSQNNGENYESWTHKQLVKEIKKLRAEIEKLRADKSINNSEKQSRLAKKLEKLEKLEKAKVGSLDDNSNNNFPTSLVIGGGILIAVGLVAALAIKKNKKKRT